MSNSIVKPTITTNRIAFLSHSVATAMLAGSESERQELIISCNQQDMTSKVTLFASVFNLASQSTDELVASVSDANFIHDGINTDTANAVKASLQEIQTLASQSQELKAVKQLVKQNTLNTSFDFSCRSQSAVIDITTDNQKISFVHIMGNDINQLKINTLDFNSCCITDDKNIEELVTEQGDFFKAESEEVKQVIKTALLWLEQLNPKTMA